MTTSLPPLMQNEPDDIYGLLDRNVNRVEQGNLDITETQIHNADEMQGQFPEEEAYSYIDDNGYKQTHRVKHRFLDGQGRLVNSAGELVGACHECGLLMGNLEPCEKCRNPVCIKDRKMVKGVEGEQDRLLCLSCAAEAEWEEIETEQQTIFTRLLDWLKK